MGEMAQKVQERRLKWYGHDETEARLSKERDGI